MRKFLFCLFVIFALAMILVSQPNSAISGSDQAAELGLQDWTPEDVLTLVKEQNSSRFATPGSKFNKMKIKRIGTSAKRKKKGSKKLTLSFKSKSVVPTPAVYQGNLYASGGLSSSHIYCMDADTGKKVWTVKLSDSAPSSPTVSDDSVVVTTGSCTIYSLSATTGKMKWSHFLAGSLVTTPTIDNGKVFTTYPVGYGKYEKDVVAIQSKKTKPRATHVLGCFDLETGEILWQRWIMGDAMTAPVAAGDDVYLNTFSGVTYRIRQSDGEILAASLTGATAAPTIIDNEVYFPLPVAGNSKSLASGMMTLDDVPVPTEEYTTNADIRVSDIQSVAYALPPQKGVIFRNVLGRFQENRLSFEGSRILVSDGRMFSVVGDQIYCTSTDSSEVIWRRKGRPDTSAKVGHHATSPLLAGGQLMIAHMNGSVDLLDSKTGKTLKTYSLGAKIRMQPAVANGTIYAGTANGKIVCLKTGNKELTGWDMWGGNAQHNTLTR